MKSIPRIQLKKLLKHEVTLGKFTEGNLSGDPDNIYDQHGETFTTHTILCEIQPITMEDETSAVPGILHAGDAWGFFLPYYWIEGEQITIDPEDHITCEGVTYAVARTEDHYQGNNIVWRRAYLRRVTGE